MAPQTGPSKLTLHHVTKRFVDSKRGRETVALEDISLRIADGEFVCLLGPSGCGKSTVLNLVAGFEERSEGEVLLEGSAVRKPGPDRGVVFQQPLLFPWLTVLDNITFGPRMTGGFGKQSLEAAHRYVKLVGLAGFERHYPYELSGGMQQRVAIARAWISEPGVLLMDEPFGALDAQTRLMMQELLLRVWEEKRTTVLFVTHDIDEALFLADRVIVMSARPGRVKENLQVPFARPRDYDTIIFDPDYVRLKQHVLHAIRQETERGMLAPETLQEP
jgi:NitT/TauT family transport system ATP-binding protein